MSLRIGNRVRHHTNEQVVEIVRDTLSIAADAELSDADRTLLLPEIFRVAANHHLEIEQIGPADLSKLMGRG